MISYANDLLIWWCDQEYIEGDAIDLEDFDFPKAIEKFFMNFLFITVYCLFLYTHIKIHDSVLSYS